MNGSVNILVSRASALIPCMLDAVKRSKRPLILVPESFTLTTEQALIGGAEKRGFIGTQVFSPTSLIREIKERAGFPGKALISGDGRNMILSLLLLKNRDRLLFYRENSNQASMAEKLASQIDDLADSGFDHRKLEEISSLQKKSSAMKCRDIALIWEEYGKILETGYIDRSDAWTEAMKRLEKSGIIQGMDLLIFGFDRINMNLTDLITTAYPLAGSITVGLVSETGCDDDYIFAYTSDSVNRFLRRMKRLHPDIPAAVGTFSSDDAGTDPGIRFIERNVFAPGRAENVPDLSAVSVYYAENTYVECLYTVQTLIRWHREGIAWRDMAVAVCDDTTLPSMLPLVMASAGVPFTSRVGISMLMSEYAQFFLAVMRSIRTNFRQDEMLKLVKSRFSGLSDDEMMDMENYVRRRGIDRGRWLTAFEGEDEETALLEEMRQRIAGPLSELRKTLSSRECTGKKAAEAIYGYMTGIGAYETLLRREKELIEADMPVAADRNRQVWTAVNEILDQLASFAQNDHLSADELCHMLEAAISARMIKSLPQVAESVIISSPNMFFSSGMRAVAVVGMQERSSVPPAALLTQAECTELLRSVGDDDVYASIGVTRRQAAARAKQEINRAIASAKERILFSSSARKPNGTVLTQSREYRDIYELVKKHRSENVMGGLTKDDLSPFTPQFALERLATMLRAAGEENESFLTRDDPVSAEWRDTLSFLYNDGYWHDKTAAVLGALNVRISSPGIPPQLAARLYGQNRLSVSAIETAGTCMYWAFLSYALHVRERKDFVFETDSEGTFSHEVLKEFFDRAAALPSFPALSDGEIASLLDSVMTAQIKPWENGPLGRNMSGRFRGEEITAYVGTAVTTLAKAIKNVPHFRPIGMEVGFGRMHTDSKLHFPPVTLTLDGGETITISGVIDRVDTAEFDDGRKAVLVYDFKSSDKDVRADALKAGVQLQLPIYLIAVKQGMPDYILAGALYQPVKEVIDKADDGDIAKINENIDNALRARGVFLSDEIIKKASYPLKVPKNMSNTNLISAVTAEGLEDVMKKGADSAINVIERMLSGDTTPNPLQDGMRSPCEYCGMKEACPFDSRLEGGRLRKLSEPADDED